MDFIRQIYANDTKEMCEVATITSFFLSFG